MRALAIVAIFAAIQGSVTACKETKQGGGNGSGLDAEAALVASGQEVLLSQDSLPEPKPSAKLTAEDLNAELHQLGGEIFGRGDVAKFQVPGSDLTGTPPELQGIWWMDGNPLADETVSFARTDFSMPQPLFPVFGLNNFSFHSGTEPGKDGFVAGDRDFRDGLVAFSLAKASGLVYEFTWTGSPSKYTAAKIVPTVAIKILGKEKRLRISPKIMAFTMAQKSKNLYLRENSFFGKPVPGYDLRRILIPSASDPKVLEKTEWWDLYMKQPGPAKIRLPTRG